VVKRSLRNQNIVRSQLRRRRRKQEEEEEEEEEQQTKGFSFIHIKRYYRGTEGACR